VAPGATSLRESITRRHANLLLVAAVMTTLLVAMGGIVCATESGAACPDWPGCYGRIIPPPQIAPVIEYTHRFIALLTGPLVVAGAVMSWRKTRAIRWITWPLTVAILFIAAVVVFGAFAVLTGLPRPIAALDLGSALIALALVVTAATVARTLRGDPALPERLSARTGLSRLSLLTLIAVYAVYVGGILVAGKGSPTRCLGWPMWQIMAHDVAGWPQVARLVIGTVAAILVVAVVLSAWHRGASIRWAAAWLAAAFLIELAVGAVLVAGSASAVLALLHVAAAAALWSLLVVLTVRAGLESAAEGLTKEAGGAPAAIPARPA
jgi:heme a synthase